MLVLDIQGTQSPDHRDRGVARYVRELALAIEDRAPGAVAHYSLNPDLPLPGGIEPLVASGKLAFSNDIAWADVDVLHVMSPYELAVPIERLLPRRFTGALVVTLFDLISEVLADPYLADAGLRRRYRARHELVRQADLVLAISRSTARDAVRLLGIDGERPGGSTRIEVTHLAPSAAFRADDTVERQPFVLYTGGTDHRKNVERLLEAWGGLSPSVRRRFDLVLACSVKPPERNHFEVMAERLGFRDSLRVTGWIPEAELVRLTQAATLAVWPSLYEGFGLPVAEALACGTPVLGSDTSSTPELLPPDALFDPTDVVAITAALERALADSGHLERLRAGARAAPRRSYDDVAAETLAAYERVGRLPLRRRPRPRGHGTQPTASNPRRLAFVSPLPPVRGGVSDYSFRLLDELHRRHPDLEIDAFVDGPPHEREAVLDARAPEGVTVRPLAALDRIEAWSGPYDRLVASLGNSEYHTGALALLHRRRDVVVLAHDVRLTNLYRFAAWQHPEGLVDGSFAATLHASYPGLPPELGSGGKLDPDDAERWGVLLARDAISRSARYLVTSEFARKLALLDAGAENADRLAVLPFSVGAVPLADPTPAIERPGPPLVTSFGVVNDLKLGGALLDAFRRVRAEMPAARLLFVGPCGPAEAAALTVPGVEVTGALPAEEYLRWLDRSWVSVQLRAATNGESSGAVGDCLTAGIPTVVTAIGAARDLPDDAVVKLPADAGPDRIAVVLLELLGDPDRRTSLQQGAMRYASTRSFAAAADALYDELFGD